MSFHLLVSTFEVGRFLQIVGLISLPIILVTLSVIVWLHYRKRKQPAQPEQLSPLQSPVFFLEDPPTVIPMDGQPPFIRENTLVLLYNSKQRLEALNTKYEGLQQQYEILQQSFEELQDTSSMHLNTIHMENEIRPSETDYRYLQDMMQEKQLQIEFLQNQLSQRVRSFHELEARERDASAAMDRLQDQVRQQEKLVMEMGEKLKQKQVLLAGIHTQLSAVLTEEENTVIRMSQPVAPAEHNNMVAFGA